MQLSVIEILKAILFGIVEGVTEWLPISSTGHMILLNEFVKLDVSPEFWNLFLVVIQLGAILAVVILYWKTIWPFKKVTLKSGKSKIVLRKSTLMLWLRPVFPRALWASSRTTGWTRTSTTRSSSEQP